MTEIEKMKMEMIFAMVECIEEIADEPMEAVQMAAGLLAIALSHNLKPESDPIRAMDSVGKMIVEGIVKVRAMNESQGATKQ